MRKLLRMGCLTAALLTLPMMGHAGSYEDFFAFIRLDDGFRLRNVLSRGMDPNSLSEQGLPALVEAMNQDADSALEALLNSPLLEVNVQDAKGDTPLMLACAKNKPQWVSALLKKGAVHTEAGRWNALHYAASAGSLTTIQLLLNAGADINVHSANNTTPLMMAARAGKDDAARLLMNQGAELLLVNDAGLDALAYAQRAQRATLVQDIKRWIQALPREE